MVLVPPCPHPPPIIFPLASMTPVVSVPLGFGGNISFVSQLHRLVTSCGGQKVARTPTERDSSLCPVLPSLTPAGPGPPRRRCNLRYISCFRIAFPSAYPVDIRWGVLPKIGPAAREPTVSHICQQREGPKAVGHRMGKSWYWFFLDNFVEV